MAQPHRKGHKFGNKNMRRRIERTQRQATKVILAGKKKGIKGKVKKHKPKTKANNGKVVKPYPCGPKQMALGEVTGNG